MIPRKRATKKTQGDTPPRGPVLRTPGYSENIPPPSFLPALRCVSSWLWSILTDFMGFRGIFDAPLFLFASIFSNLRNSLYLLDLCVTCECISGRIERWNQGRVWAVASR